MITDQSYIPTPVDFRGLDSLPKGHFAMHSREGGEVGNAVVHADGCGEGEALDRDQIS